MSSTLQELSNICGAELKGDASCKINSVNTLKSAKKGDISFLSNRRYVDYLKLTNASAVILVEEDIINCPTNALVTDNPYLAYAKIANHLYPQIKYSPGISAETGIYSKCNIDESASISANISLGKNVEIDKNSYIAPGCVIEEGVKIGENCQIFANVTLCHDVVIGNDVIIHPGVVVGSDGFGLAPDNGKWLKIPQIGSVVIHDRVEIGANSTIDRGAIEDTVIHSGVKIDNQVQVGHNVIIDQDTAIAGCVAIAGSTFIGKRCQIGGASGISGHITIADDVIITGMSGVANSITKSGIYSAGIPVTDNRTWRKNIVRFKHLDKTIRNIFSILDKE